MVKKNFVLWMSEPKMKIKRISAYKKVAVQNCPLVQKWPCVKKYQLMQKWLSVQKWRRAKVSLRSNSRRAKVTLRAKESPCKSVHSFKSDHACKRSPCKRSLSAKVTRSHLKRAWRLLTITHYYIVNHYIVLR